MTSPLTFLEATSSLHSAGIFHPVLGPALLERLQCYGTEELVDKSSFLFVRGERDVDWFVILDGAIEVFENAGNGRKENIIAHLTDGQFTGELRSASPMPTHRKSAMNGAPGMVDSQEF